MADRPARVFADCHLPDSYGIDDMEFLILLGIGLTIGGVAIALDDDDEVQEESNSSEPMPESLTEDGNSITTSDGDDDFTASDQDETIFLRGGNDVAEGRGGDDRIFGGDGEDVIVGGEGDDFLRGGSEDDTLVDNAGSDTIYGDGGNDLIFATTAVDGEGIVNFARGVSDGSITDFTELNQYYTPDTDTDAQADEVFGGAGDDTVIAGDGDTVTLGSGSDTLGVGDWVVSNHDPVTVTDFDPGEDVLVYSHDGEGPTPELSVNHLFDGEGTALLFADNVLVARLPGVGEDFSLGDVSIVDRGGSGSTLV